MHGLTAPPASKKRFSRFALQISDY